MVLRDDLRHSPNSSDTAKDTKQSVHCAHKPHIPALEFVLIWQLLDCEQKQKTEHDG